MKKLTLALVLILISQPVAASAADSVSQRTFSGVGSESLSSKVRNQISAFAFENSLASTATCTAIRRSADALRASRESAKLVCDYVKKLNPALSVSVQSKVSSKPGFAGKVLVTFRTPSSAASAKGVVEKVPTAKTLSALSMHVKALDQAARNLKPIAISYVAGPTTVPSKVSMVVTRFQDKLKMYQLLGLTSLSMDWVIASEKDYAWWREYRLKQVPDYPISVWDNSKKELGHCRLSSDIFCGAGNEVKGKTYQDNVVGTAFSGKGLDYVTRHEAAHFYQAVFGYGGRCWFAEGQATFFETYLETSSRSRSQVIERLKQSPSGVARNSLASLEKQLFEDTVCQRDFDIAYDLGMLAFEYLYMSLSFKQVHNLQVLSSDGGWSQAIEVALGTDPETFHKELALYVYQSLR